RRFALLLFAHGGQLLAGDRLVVRALVAAGRKHVVDGPSLGAPAGDAAGRTEVDVVGVGHDRHERERPVGAERGQVLRLLAATEGAIGASALEPGDHGQAPSAAAATAASGSSVAAVSSR